MHLASIHMKDCHFSFFSPNIPLKSKDKVWKSWRSYGGREAAGEWPEKLAWKGHMWGSHRPFICYWWPALSSGSCSVVTLFISWYQPSGIQWTLLQVLMLPVRTQFFEYCLYLLQIAEELDRVSLLSIPSQSPPALTAPGEQLIGTVSLSC